jgi:uncharacterized protein (UPF0332 family)
MSKTQALALSIITGAINPVPGGVVLSAQNATKLKLALESDAKDYSYSGLVTLGEAIRGVTEQRYSWATVKAYYATFYFARAILGYNGVGLWNWNGIYYSLSAQAGAVPKKLSKNTHSSALKLFDSSNVVPHLCNQMIGIDSAIKWLTNQRVAANYTSIRFCDPASNPCFTKISRGSLRQFVEAYALDKQGTYYLDADHAMLAFPIELAKLIHASQVISLAPDERMHLKILFRDSAGPLASAKHFFALT